MQSSRSENEGLDFDVHRRSWGYSGGWPFSPLSPGDVHGLFVERISKVIGAAKGDYSEAMRTGLMNLGATGLINTVDVALLSKMIDIINSTKGIIERISAVRALNIELLASEGTGPLARAIFSIAIDSLVNQGSLPTPLQKNIAGADVAGAFLGATVGGSVGAAWGGLIGVLVGGAAFSAIEGLG